MKESKPRCLLNNTLQERQSLPKRQIYYEQIYGKKYYSLGYYTTYYYLLKEYKKKEQLCPNCLNFAGKV